MKLLGRKSAIRKINTHTIVGDGSPENEKKSLLITIQHHHHYLLLTLTFIAALLLYSSTDSGGAQNCDKCQSSGW